MSVGVLISLVVFLPLIGGIAGFLFNDKYRPVSSFSVGVAFLCALYVLVSVDEAYLAKGDWLMNLQIGILVDKPSAILLTLVTFISLLVHLFSKEYMKDDSGRSRYFLKLGFFTFSMLGLLVADSLLLLFIFWELVGFSSYLLIGFWYDRKGISSSARVAFMVNRIADVSLLVGILILNAQGHSLFISEFKDIWLFLPSLLITIGAFGKSAQWPFSGWLTKAMVGPTPVSALIHAATMVAAGVYLLYRIAPVLPSDVTVIISVVGAVTAFYGAISAITQNDIKKILAYSTISQLGYMVIGTGVGAREASMFHLWTHAFFKAGLFLGAGVAIHYLHQLAKENNQVFDPQDIRRMGGLKGRLPLTFLSFVVCGFALAGIPMFSGFLSKESIIYASLVWADQIGTWAYLVPDIALITVVITAFYIGRLIVLVFLGESRSNGIAKNFEFKENLPLQLPLLILATGSLWFFYGWNPLSHTSWLNQFFGSESSSNETYSSALTSLISITLSIGGMVLAYTLFKPGSNFSSSYSTTYQPVSFSGKLVFNGFYLTTVYQSIGNFFYSLSRSLIWIDTRVLDGIIHFFAVGGVVLSKGLYIIDRLIVDGFVNLISIVARALGKGLSGVHSDEIQWQIIWLLLALVLILSWTLLF